MASNLGSKRADYYAGALMIVIGAAAIAQSRSYDLGTLERMGPGFFPTSVGVLLIAVGAAIALSAKPAPPDPAHPASGPDWRGWLCIAAGILSFVVLGNHGGLVPATFAIVFISAMGDRRNTPQSAGILAAATVFVGVVVFWWLLKVQLPLLRWG